MGPDSVSMSAAFVAVICVLVLKYTGAEIVCVPPESVMVEVLVPPASIVSVPPPFPGRSYNDAGMLIFNDPTDLFPSSRHG